MDLAIEFFSRNLATMSNFVEFRDSRDFVKFRDSRNFMFFEAPRVAGDTWHTMSG